MNALLSAARIQLAMFGRAPADLVALALAPAFSLVFIGIASVNDRDDLVPHAAVAPVAIAMLSMAITKSGALIDLDRHAGTIELLLASPTSLAHVLLGRITTITAASLLSVGETVLVAGLLTDTDVAVERPGLFILSIALMAAATVGVAMVMAALFVRTRYAVTLQNSLSYPLYLLGGVLVPVAALPDWLEPLSRLLYLSWATDLLRASLVAGSFAPYVPHVTALSVLAAGNLLVGWSLVGRLSDRARRSGEVGHA